MAQGGTPKHDRKFVKLNILISISISRKKIVNKIFSILLTFFEYFDRGYFLVGGGGRI